jgi:hypothetical protein
VESRKKEPFSRALAIGIFLAIVAAATGYIVSIVGDQRKREIEFADQQIEKLYGPLFALSTATLRASTALFLNVRPGKTVFFDEHDPPSPKEVEIWRRWIKTVFQPMNVKMETAIIDNAQLIEGGHIYPLFVDLILHVESYRATIAKWKDTDAENPHFVEASENTAMIAFPKGFDRCVELRFDVLRARRDRLKRSWILAFETPEDRPFPEGCS